MSFIADRPRREASRSVSGKDALLKICVAVGVGVGRTSTVRSLKDLRGSLPFRFKPDLAHGGVMASGERFEMEVRLAENEFVSAFETVKLAPQSEAAFEALRQARAKLIRLTSIDCLCGWASWDGNPCPVHGGRGNGAQGARGDRGLRDPGVVGVVDGGASA